MSVLVEKMQNRIFFLRWFLYSISQVHNDLKILYFFRQAVGIIGASMWVQLGALRAAKDFHRSLLARINSLVAPHSNLCQKQRLHAVREARRLDTASRAVSWCGVQAQAAVSFIVPAWI